MSLPAQITMQHLARVFTAQAPATSTLVKTPGLVGRKVVQLVLDYNKPDSMATRQESSKEPHSRPTQVNRSKGE